MPPCLIFYEDAVLALHGIIMYKVRGKSNFSYFLKENAVCFLYYSRHGNINDLQNINEIYRANELGNYSHLYLPKLLFLSMFGWYTYEFCLHNMTCVSVTLLHLYIQCTQGRLCVIIISCLLSLFLYWIIYSSIYLTSTSFFIDFFLFIYLCFFFFSNYLYLIHSAIFFLFWFL